MVISTLLGLSRRLTLLPSVLAPAYFRGSLSVCHPTVKELIGYPKFFDVSFHAYRALYSGRPSEVSPVTTSLYWLLVQ